MLRAASIVAAVATASAGFTYTVTVSDKGSVPAMSIKKPVGQGYSPCECTFNPSWFDVHPGLDHNIMVMRVSGCTPEFGGGEDHLAMANCYSNGTCSDLLPLLLNASFEAGSEDPRVFYYPTDGYWYMYYYAPGPGQSTVYLRRSATPLDPASWELVVAELPWHRNGCVILREDGTHYVIFGETGALPGIGIATTTNFVNYTYLNKTWLEPNGANNTDEPEIVLEAASNVVTLSTGDYLHIYAAGTPGWVANGNYTGGYLILSKDDPSVILQRSKVHIMVPTMDYEIGDGIWPVQRNRTIFATSLVPVEGQVDTYRLWYGAADANIASCIVTVTHA